MGRGRSLFGRLQQTQPDALPDFGILPLSRSCTPLLFNIEPELSLPLSFVSTDSSRRLSSSLGIAVVWHVTILIGQQIPQITVLRRSHAVSVGVHR